MLDQLLTYEELYWQKKWFLQNRTEDTSFLIRLSTRRNSPSSVTGNFMFKISVVSLLVPAFKYIPERLYAPLPVTVITLTARAALSNAVLGQCLWAFPSSSYDGEEEQGGREEAVICQEINRCVRLMNIVN